MKLPVEVLSLIVKYVKLDDLYACALVNKQFLAATLPELWHQPTVDTDMALMKVTSGLVLSPSLGKHVRRLDFGSFINDTILMLFLPHVSLLEGLYLQHAPLISDRSFQHVRLCPHLKDLYIASSPITTHAITVLGQHCKHLTSLSLQDCPHLSCDLFGALLDLPLVSLTLDMEAMYMIDAMETAVAQLAQLGRLTHLCLWGAPTRFIELVTTATWPHLEQCIFSGDNTLDDHHAIAFILAHPHLVDLSLGSTVSTDALLYAIAAALPRIQSIVMNANVNITPKGVRHLAQHCPLLRHINIF